MKSFKQFMAVFMTAVFLAGSLPLTLSAADRRENTSMVSAGSSTDTAADADQQAETETDSDRAAGHSAETMPEMKAEEETDSCGWDETADGPDGSIAETVTEDRSTSATITKYRGSKLKKGKTYYVRIVTRRKRNGVFCTVPMPAANTYIGTFRF